ncbi:pentatricopeptide repeat-containing protein At2g45350, chloroplastic [Macadamia integrifolia]|uniref:pentatricopeptide repeat-containing protein At2g45350, chloroplastic n=1 Tax=Macadamia integrifolia TaxID=60698 RepID=UPI001C52F33A|nr:pentatricopeptide repeat-containing protein At2g45350, chloroplastic [Macadamia integrifolia]
MVVCVHSCQPWNSTLPTLPLLGKCRTLSDVNQIHARIITTGLIRNAALTTKIVLNFASSPHPPLIEFARYVFFFHHASEYQRKHDDPFLWNAIIRSFSHGFDPKRAIVVFSVMLQLGIPADRFSYSLILKACSRLSLIKEGLQIHCLIGKTELRWDVFLQNSLIGFYVRCGLVEVARHVFDRMTERDSVSWNSMIDGYVKNGLTDSAAELFDKMPTEDMNLISWNSMIRGYAQSSDGLEMAWVLFNQMPERDLISWNSIIDGLVKCGKLEAARELFYLMPMRDEVSWVIMIDGFAKIGNIDTARSLFDDMPKRDVIAWNSMMGGYVQNGFSAEALKLFLEMQTERNLTPDHATLVIALSAAAASGRINEGISLHNYMEKNRFPVDGKLGVALIDMYSKCGSIKGAMWVFENLEEKGVDHWNAMINGLAIHGLGELALDLFMEMVRLSIKPDDITFIGVLNACGHAGLLKEGLMCFELMRRVYNVKPKLQHYGCMVDLLGRAGHLREARNLIEDMPIKPNDVVLRALLSACMNHYNFDMGKWVAKHLIQLDSCNSSSYVLLSNLYASFGMWSDVSKIRTIMKEKDIRKVPGCSWIELDGIVHEFVVGDKSHPKVIEIYFLLENLCKFNTEFACCKE